MKKLLAFAAAFSLASSACFVIPTAANANTALPNNGIAHACQASLNALLGGISEGDCVQIIDAFVEQNGTTDANAICNLWAAPGGAQFFGGHPFPFASVPQCIVYFNTVIY